jgi:hypothetical protein
MYIVKFETRKYEFTDKVYADGLAKTWGGTVEYKSICGDPNCHCETPCKSFHFVPRSLGEGGSPATGNRPAIDEPIDEMYYIK